MYSNPQTVIVENAPNILGNAGQNVVHEPLEGPARILQPKTHPQELPQAKGGDDGHPWPPPVSASTPS